MGVLLLRSLGKVCLLVWFLWLHGVVAQPSSESTRGDARALDALLQDYAYRAFERPKTGIPYKGSVPSNLTGIEISAMRLRSGSMFRRDIVYEEFNISRGVSVDPFVVRLVLVYQNLGNWSMSYYPLPGYTYLSPILGLLAYDAANLSAKNLPQLNLRATSDPILIKFEDVEAAPDGTVPNCVWFDSNGSPNFSNVISNNVCSTEQQGHFSIVVQSVAPSPAPTPRGEGKKKSNKKVWIIVGSVVGGLALLALLPLLVIWVRKFRQRKKMERMERAAEAGEALHMTPIGNTKAPAATVTRTQPILESEYAA